jgi:hypothetical protein
MAVLFVLIQANETLPIFAVRDLSLMGWTLHILEWPIKKKIILGEKRPTDFPSFSPLFFVGAPFKRYARRLWTCHICNSSLDDKVNWILNHQGGGTPAAAAAQQQQQQQPAQTYTVLEVPRGRPP